MRLTTSPVDPPSRPPSLSLGNVVQRSEASRDSHMTTLAIDRLHTSHPIHQHRNHTKIAWTTVHLHVHASLSFSLSLSHGAPCFTSTARHLLCCSTSFLTLSNTPPLPADAFACLHPARTLTLLIHLDVALTFPHRPRASNPDPGRAPPLLLMWRRRSYLLSFSGAQPLLPPSIITSGEDLSSYLLLCASPRSLPPPVLR